MKPIEDLLADDSVWPEVSKWLDAAVNSIEVLEPDKEKRDDVLLPLQVSTKSTMGAIIYETGGIMVDHNWLRILGSGHPKLPRSITEWNRFLAGSDTPDNGLLYIADDVLGGLFAMNGGALDGALGDVHYFAIDTLAWESLEMGYTKFISWVLGGDLDRFYGEHRWKDWQAETENLEGDRGISIYPFLFTEGPPVVKRSRQPVPFAELASLHFSIRAQLIEKMRSNA